MVLTDWPSILLVLVLGTVISIWAMTRPHTKYHESDECAVCRERQDG